MYDFYHNTLVIPGRALYEDLGVMSKSNYDKQCSSGKLNKVRTAGGLDNTALVEFESIPERFRVEIVRKLGFPPKKEAQHLILKYYKTDYEAIDFFANYLLEDYRRLSPEKQDEYVRNAQMIQAVDAYMKDMKAFRKSRGGSITKIWQEAAIAVKEVKDQIGHTLPGTDRRLRDKLAEFAEHSYKSLISDNYGKKKAIKVKNATQEALLRQLLRDHRNLDNEQIAMIYNSVAKIQGFPELSAGTIGNYRKKWNLLVYAGTNGEKAFNDNIGMQVKRKAPSAPLLFWTVDGWDIELLYQRQTVNLKGEKVTTYHNRLTMVVVLDPVIKYPIGYAIGREESSGLIQQALRNAILHTEELFGQKHKVLQIQSDNYSKKTMTPIYEMMSKKFTPAKVGNAKSKIIEPWFKFFNKKYCQLAPNWSGHGVKFKTQPNEEYLNKIRHSFPDENGCITQIVTMIEIERERLKEQYIEAYNNMHEDAKKEISNQDFLLHFGETTGYTNKVNHNGLHIAINGKKHEYDSFDINFRMHSHLDWTIKYDSNNLNEVLAYNEDHNISFMLQEKYVQPMALYDRKEGDAEELSRIGQFNKEIKQVILDTQADDYKEVNQMFIQHPELDGTLAKMVIVDSKGQHKDQRNSKRIDRSKKLLNQQEKKIEKKEAFSWDKEHENYIKNKVNTSKYFDNE
ncbi:hypothetical protein [Elizabethkingia anophelis]|uniref:hypothetical protein n=1 Tax=Elizabethkingia anophelis TaxID=1117645 RepID=UPI0012B239C0|nr:hypothetical protein [Elizabethkingia anophelis]QGN21583.1 hypothetical protein GJV56_02620 [Elizabethkingia anophelis]UTG04607.1 hypothetical protein J2O03_02630 [Elizabethkingia anophelis]UTG08349.1 hypothetical protein J2N99_02625 [Elizabethkingia anophelis]UTG12091.1 hypothetical protein J2N92_02625 [Elizabethkingia anophelis]UTG15806.1 hypothetical protein J2O12_02625 [Elizabethkingia anophelis]